MKKLLFSVLVLIALSFTSCSDDNDTPATANLDLNISGLENLGNDYNYEGWIIVNGSPVSTGTFSVDDSGVLSQTSFQVNVSQLVAATRFVLSIEPNPDPDSSPATTKILAGDFVSNTATINSDNIVVASNSTIGTLGASTGKYILATPTDGSNNSNEESGVWFIDNSSGSMQVGLSLPTLTPGWKYEGWVDFGNGSVISTGTFTTASGEDDNAATSVYKGTAGNGPNFPGEDYLLNAPTGLTFPTDLKDKTVVISVEPDPDNSTDPFTLKPLAGVIPADINPYEVQGLGAGSVSIISGTVSR